MGRLINRIFIYAYAWHYERRNLTLNTDPTGIASWLLGLWVGSCLTAIWCASSVIIKYDVKSIYFIVCIACFSLIAAGLFNSYYINKNRAINLYSQYKSSRYLKTPIKRIIIVIFLCFPRLSF